MWDEDSDGTFSLKQMAEYWRAPAEEFFAAFLSRPLGTRRLPTFSEYLEAVTRAFHAEAESVFGHAPPSGNVLVAHVNGVRIGPTGPVHEGEVSPFRRVIVELSDTWRDPKTAPHRPILLKELVACIEFGSATFFAGSRWLRWDDVDLPERFPIELESADGARIFAALRWDEEAEPSGPEDDGLRSWFSRLEEFPEAAAEIERHLGITAEALSEAYEEGISDLGAWARLAVRSTNEGVRTRVVAEIVRALCSGPIAEPLTEEALPIAIAHASARDRARVALVSNLPEHVVMSLARDAEPTVRASIAVRYRDTIAAHAELLAAFDADRDVVVRAGYEKSSHLLRCLAAHPRWDVRATVVHRESSAEAKRDLARQSLHFRRILSQSRGNPIDVIDAFSRDEDEEVRKWTAMRLNDPKVYDGPHVSDADRALLRDVFDRLMNDPSKRVRRNAEGSKKRFPRLGT